MSGMLRNGRGGRSKRSDPLGHHVRIYHFIYNSPAFRALSYSARALYLEIRCLLNGRNNGDLSVTLAVLRRRGWKSSATIAKGLRALLAVGLIKKTRQGGITAGGEFCCLYAVTDETVPGFPGLDIPASRATNDYRKFQTVADAMKAIEDAPLRGARKKRKVQKLPIAGSESELQTAVSSSEISGSPRGRFNKFTSRSEDPLPFT